MHDTAMNGSVLRATVVSKLTRLYPFLTGCGTVANHPLVDALAGHPKSDTWAAVEGGRLSVSLADHVGRAAFYVGDLDRKVSALIDRFVKPGDTVLDIGANIGLVAFRLSKRVGPGGKVHAFEPNSAVADRFERSLAANAISNVEIHRIALGSEPGTQPLSIPSGNAGAASLVSGRVEGKTADVRVERLDDLNLGPVSFVKMDVEGFEEQVLRGYARTLRSAPPPGDPVRAERRERIVNPAFDRGRLHDPRHRKIILPAQPQAGELMVSALQRLPRDQAAPHPVEA